jgi:hypothetical protein
LHRIPDLSEHFLYANDDTFFGGPVVPGDFFLRDGRFKVFLTPDDMETEQSLHEFIKSYHQFQKQGGGGNGMNTGKMANTMTKSISRGKNSTGVRGGGGGGAGNKNNEGPVEAIHILPYFTSQAQVNAVLDQVFGKPDIRRKRLKHQIKPMRKSTFEVCWDQELMQLYLFNTSSTRFRSLTDIDVTSLIAHTGLQIGHAVSGTISSKYYGLTDDIDVKMVFRHMLTCKPSKLLCINDDRNHDDEEKSLLIKTGFEKCLPHRNPRSETEQQAQTQKQTQSAPKTQSHSYSQGQSQGQSTKGNNNPPPKMSGVAFANSSIYR